MKKIILTMIAFGSLSAYADPADCSNGAVNAAITVYAETGLSAASDAIELSQYHAELGTYTVNGNVFTSEVYVQFDDAYTGYEVTGVLQATDGTSCRVTSIKKNFLE